MTCAALKFRVRRCEQAFTGLRGDARLSVVACRVGGVVARGQEGPPVHKGKHDGALRREKPQQQQEPRPNLRRCIEYQCLPLHGPHAVVTSPRGIEHVIGPGHCTAVKA